MRIVLFDIDSLRPDHLGCYGYNRPTSPTIDSIAAQGTRFTRYYCSDSPCVPSRMAFTSGRFGINNGVTHNTGAGHDFHIAKRGYGGPRDEHQMLFRQLRKFNGLDTVAFSNFADRHNAMWFMSGWTEFHTPNLKGGGETAEEVNERVMPWLKANATRENYLLYINYWDAHRIYKMDPQWADPIKDIPVTQAWPDEAAIARHQSIGGPFTAHRQFPDDKSAVPLMPGAIDNRADFEHMITGYDASIRYVDHHIKQVLDELERQGALKDTAVIVTADHGDAFGEHGVYSDHAMASECINRVPLIVKWPGLAPSNGECDSLLYNVDFSATLCDLLGAPIPEDWDGRSFLENLKDPAGERGAGEGKRIERDYIVFGHGLYTLQRAVRTRTHLLIRTYDAFGYSNEPVELYDKEADFYETVNLRDSRPDLVARLDHCLAEWRFEQTRKMHIYPDPFDMTLQERKLQRLAPPTPPGRK